MTKPFKPAFGLKNRHLQTLYSSIFRKVPDIDVQEEMFELSDGDFVECNWYNRPSDEGSTPIVVLFHGLAGSVNSPYIKGLMLKLKKSGYSSVLMHFRGCSNKMNRLARSYHSGDTDDAKEWFAHLKQKYPKSSIYAVGYSLGGNMLLKLLGELKENSPVKAAVAISAPMQLEISANRMNSGFSRLYQYLLMKDLKEHLKEKYSTHDMKSLIGIDKEDIDKFKTFWELDNAYTAPIHGFSSAKDYYAKSSSREYLKDITTNTLIIYSLDDPFMTPKILPKKSEVSKRVKLEIHRYGGHVGFISGNIFTPKYWLEDRIINYFEQFKS